MSRTKRDFDEEPLMPMQMDMDRNYLELPSFFGKKKKKNTSFDEKTDNIGKKARTSLTAKQYVGAACCPDEAAYPCAWCCAGCNFTQCLVTCCCPT